MTTRRSSTQAAPAVASGEGWLGTWSCAHVVPAPTGRSRSGFRDQTIRNIIHAAVGGSAVRIRLSNVFGERPLRLGGAHVAVRLAGAATVPGTTRAVTFGGDQAVTIPVGERVWSDPVTLSVDDGADLAVSLYFAAPTGPATWHPAALSTSYRSAAGDHGADQGRGSFGQQSTSWFFLDGVDVRNATVRGAVVAFGPSTTDGVASTLDANGRYPDLLARRLRQLPPGERMSVLNAGIAGNKLLADAGTSGQSALDRFLRDAAGQSGVRAVILWEGTNDVATRPDLPLGEVTGAYQRLIGLAHSRGLRIVGATLQPHEGAWYYSHAGNRLREAVNDWIRWSGAFDGVADFDQVLRDPRHPRRLLPGYDSGDHLHPNDDGYLAIAASVDLAALTGAGGEERVASGPAA
ncbi:SGNH/GDSL hydrolase family protein [Trebonia kvetii]|uniref:SGNH/GDSL hydrolase family protein n=1 Tax=Trebonia kvetii TaxID=2480626 RepID=A0A6P2C3N2_9ACTN|nr:SGNH/GDSL hydrolase family protein [Trebonia kvetii]TVZ04821.1 SGNH/GDSL hydrolase family protein [Trebonia kvetii]